MKITKLSFKNWKKTSCMILVMLRLLNADNSFKRKRKKTEFNQDKVVGKKTS